MDITKELLEQYYITEKRSKESIAKLLGISAVKLNKMLAEFGIRKVSKSETLESSINVEELTRYYIEENHALLETAEHFHCTGPQLRVILKKHGIVKDREKVKEVTKQACLKKYGVESINQAAEIKERKKQTCLERYGVANTLQTEYAQQRTREALQRPEVREKRLASLRARTPEQLQAAYEKRLKTKLEKYGEGFQKRFSEQVKETYMKLYGVPYSVEGHERAKQTCLEKYGSEAYFSSEQAKEHHKAVKFERYGGYFNLEKVAETKRERYGDPYYNNREKASQTNRERYGVDWYCMSPDCYPEYRVDSKPNVAFAELLTEHGIEYEREFALGSRCYDFKVGDTLIEIDPAPAHNSTWGFRGGEPKTATYHRDKSRLAQNNNYHCIHVWDWDDTGKIVQMLAPKTAIYARKCEIREVDKVEANRFLEANHLQGKCRGQEVGVGLYYEGELIELMTFGKPRYNKNYDYELLRLCSDKRYSVIGGSERLFKYFTEHCPGSIVSYCDNSKFSGQVYSKLGFKLLMDRNPSKHWYSIATKEHITDNFLRQRGFDQIFGDRWGKFGKGTSNDILMREHGFVEIYDAGQSTYVYEPVLV